MWSYGISLASSRMALEAAAAAQRLNFLDDLWTSYAQTFDQTERSAENREALLHLVNDMQIGLADMQPRASDLCELASIVGEEAITRAVDELTIEVPNRDQVRVALGLLSGRAVFADALVAACEHVRDEAPAESEELQAKLEILLGGFPAGEAAAEAQAWDFEDAAIVAEAETQAEDPQPDEADAGEAETQAGDFNLNFKCALTIIGAGGLVVSGAIMGALAGVAIGAVALGTVGGSLGGASGGLIAVAASPCLDKTPKLA
jgi:hypothetical protein